MVSAEELVHFVKCIEHFPDTLHTRYTNILVTLVCCGKWKSEALTTTDDTKSTNSQNIRPTKKNFEN